MSRDSHAELLRGYTRREREARRRRSRTLAVVNAVGDVLDWRTGRIIAGARRLDGRFADSVDVIREIVSGTPGRGVEDGPLRSTTLAVVATNVDLSKTSLTKLAMMANCGAARAIRPYHTTGDGDQLFAVSTAKLQRPDLGVTVLDALAADLVLPICSTYSPRSRIPREQ